MSIEIEKKPYIAPQMDVVEMQAQVNLLQDSGTHGSGKWDKESETTEYDGEFQ